MASLLNGLSAMGASTAQFAEKAGLEQQKSDLQRQTVMLADQLAGARESAGRQEAGGIAAMAATLADQRIGARESAGRQESGQIAEAAQGRQFQQQSSESALADQRISARESAGRQEAAQIAEATQGRTQTFQAGESEKTRNAPTTEIKNAQWWAKATPEERQAYRSELMAKAGLPEWMSGPDTVSPAVSPASPAPATGAPESAASRNDKALEGMPPAAASIVKGMVEGRIQTPPGRGIDKPYWQAMLQKATEYDPTFDQTTWTGRVATRKDFASGQSAKAVTAMNTALGHAGTLLDDFEKLYNFGGVGTVLNQPLNAISSAFGDARQTKTRQTIDALASEARKVFASTGGGNLTELLEWQKSFPLNGSPEQQKAALTGFVELLDGRLHSLADQYNRGMGKTDDPINLLEGKGREAYKKLTGREPEGGTGYQLGKPPSGTTSAAPAMAPADPTAREVGKTYPLPNGKSGIWRGTGWELAP